MSLINLMTIGMVISARQASSIWSLLSWIVLGLLTGIIASKFLNKTGRGLVRDCLMGIVGAIVSGFLANLLGRPATPGPDFYSLIVAVVGAIVFIFVYHAMFRRGRFLQMR
jgi:uncharacterized membrane protein YeaQ/YmgE (transglycosylase-associated protein family)